MDVKEVQWSELQRDPKSVAALADAGDVRVRRRDGADLLLTREDRIATSGEGAIATVRALRNLLAHVPVETAAAALSEEFPWLGLMPSDAVAQFVAEFIKAARISAELGQWSVLAEMLRGWKSTAMVYADPDLLRQLSGPLNEDLGPVPAPVDGDADAC
ncbi:hypothetical protein Aph02nite_52530 [Actinoplanes philippinensis]|uniref:hypothetical protein n=1 Tax=Actinoplanes philippinensis TaxID=35752 RepID=UPI000B82F325|nr:hypothetical protein [Actinoplanes philippinensis]GIE79303.1 hypothetical protein Aph02nite_52530 [Actinoplanes philippinensis]